MGLENGVRGMHAGLLPPHALCTTLYTALHTALLRGAALQFSFFYNFFPAVSCCEKFNSSSRFLRCNNSFLLHKCPHRHRYVLVYIFICVPICFYICVVSYISCICVAHIYTSAELLLYIPAAIAWANIYMCPHIYRRRTIDVSSYTGTLYMCPHIQAQNDFSTFRQRLAGPASSAMLLSRRWGGACECKAANIYICPHTAVYGGSSSPLNIAALKRHAPARRAALTQVCAQQNPFEKKKSGKKCKNNVGSK